MCKKQPDKSQGSLSARPGHALANCECVYVQVCECVRQYKYVCVCALVVAVCHNQTNAQQ